MSFVFSVARRYLFATDVKGRPALVPYIGIVGVALGVAVLIVVNAIYAGYSETIQRRLLATSGHIQVKSASGSISDWQITAERIVQALSAGRGDGDADADGIDVLPVFQRQVLLRRNQSVTTTGLDVMDLPALLAADLGSSLDAEQATNRRSEGKDQGAQLTAYHPQMFVEKFALPESERQSVIKALERGQLVLGRRLAETLGVSVGQTIRLIAPPPKIKNSATASQPPPQSAISAHVTIGALVEFGLYVADTSWAVLSYERAATLLEAKGQADRLEIFVAELDRLDAVGSLIQGAIGSDMFAYNMRAQVERQTAYIRQEQQLIALVVGMTLLVASVGIVSGLVMLVHDKRREISVLRTIGARQSHILQVFLLVGAGIGLIGLSLGVSLGCFIALKADDIRRALERMTGSELFPVQYFNITDLPSKLEWQTVTMTVFFAAFLSVFAALYPAWRASKVDPALGVKGET